jgi:glycosyltransferase involved in cell wall biosynthesis
VAPEPIRVLHLIHSTAFGGGPAMVELLCTRLHGQGFEMSLVSSGEGEVPARLLALGIRVRALPLATKQSFIRHLPQLARLIRADAPDLVHVHGHWAASLGQLAIQLAGRQPTLYSAQWPAYLDDTSPYSRVRNWIAERESCQLARRVVAVSEHDRQTLIRRRLCQPLKVTLIYNAYDPARYAAAPEAAPQAPGNGRVLGFVGRLVDQKGCDVLINAMPLIVASHPTVRLRIVGDGPDRARLQDLARRLNLEPVIEFAGYQETSAQLMRGFDLVVVPSRYEPFGIVAVEAMASGRPVVASAVGGLVEIVSDGRTGRLVPPEDPGRLAAAISELLAAPDRLVAWGRAGRQRVDERFSPQASVEAYAAEYRGLAARR